MGYRGKVAEQERARELRARAWTLAEIAAELDVSKGSVSLWVRDVSFDEAARDARAAERRVAGMEHRSPWSAPRRRPPNALQRRKQAEIDELLRAGRERIGTMSEGEFLVAGVALYAGEGAKTDGLVGFANTDPRMILFHCAWLRRFFEPDESRLRLRLYLHQGLDLDAASRYWSDLTRIPMSQFHRPCRAQADQTRRLSKHVHGCPSVIYASARTHRTIMGLYQALLSSAAIPG